MEKFCTTKGEFDDIRPYNDAEVALAMQRIAQSQWLPQLAQYVFPQRSLQEVRRILEHIRTIRDFQMDVMYPFNKQVISRSVTCFECEGLDNLQPQLPYLFVSNHRDIVLDASLLQSALVDHGRDSCEITFGANLMTHPLVVDIGKSNKMFRVERGGSTRQFYLSELHLSRYIRSAIVERNQSVWIAQRNGRTKDGRDRTEPALLKMLTLSSPHNKLASLACLNIVPVAVSYEYEPCDVLKAREMTLAARHPYVKRPGEDLNSILTGIMQPKGRVHFKIAPPLTPNRLRTIEHLPLNEALRQLALMVDDAIADAYQLMPTNLAAYEMLHPDLPQNAELDAPKRWLEQRLALLDSDEERCMLLHIYANAVVAKGQIRQNFQTNPTCPTSLTFHPTSPIAHHSQ